MHLIDKALALALKVHAGQTDKAGQPYILHPLRLMAKMPDDLGKIVALLHDVIEDSEGAVALDDLRAAGFPEEAVVAVDHLTRRDDESYRAFIERVRMHALARRAKKADLEDNMDTLRLTSLTEYDLQRIAKYHLAWRRLNAADRQPEPQSYLS